MLLLEKQRLMIIQRIIVTFSIIILFWLGFIIIYLLSRLMIRLLPYFKRFYYHSSSNQYESFRPIQTLNRSDSNYANSTYGTVNLTINPHSQYQQSKISLLEYYLKTYNPLQIDLTNIKKETITTSNVKVISYEQISSETDTHSIDNCYSLNCTNKQRLYQTGRYVRLKEQENCSGTMSIINDRLSECSTKLTSTILPVIMITDCCNSQRLHTDIIEMNEEE